jgi:hypothetical protein
MNGKEELEKLQQLLDAYDACDPGTPEEAAAWKAYYDYLNELKRKHEKQ